MHKPAERLKNIFEQILPWLVLIILLFYSYINFFQHPFGFSWLSNGTINRVFVEQTGTPTLKVGDRIAQIGSLRWDAFYSDLRRPFFEGVKQGQATAIQVERNGQLITVAWILPGVNRAEQLNALANQWPIAYFFWIAGLLTVIFLRPKDERWWLLVAFNFVTAIWLVAGSGLSNYHLWYSALVLRIAIWLSLPIYLHLHWVFPRPLGILPKPLVILGYLVAVLLMVGQWFQIFSGSLYFMGFLIAILGSLILLIVHFFRQVEVRREVLFMTLLGFFAFLPIIVVTAAYTFVDNVPLISTLFLINFVTIPFAYLYIAFRRQLGGLELRMNRLISAYFFIVLVALVGIPLFAVVDGWLPTPDNTLVVGSIASLIAAALAIWCFPYFQSFLERRLLGILVTPAQLQQNYSAQTSASTSINALVDMLKDVMLPSLLVREFLFLKFDNDSTQVLLASGVDPDRIIKDPSYQKPTAWQDSNPEDSSPIKSFLWVRLVFVLKVGDDVLGVWLFGKRDPDDFYPQQELPMFRSLANQTAIALSNIIQTERLHAAYQKDIKLSEQERRRFALELHDDILNKMAMLMMELGDQNLTPNFTRLYGELTSRVREMIKELRPAALDYGIPMTLEDYVDTLNDRLSKKLHIFLDIQSDGTRYSEETELHLLRILQEACSNAVHHAGTSLITISGSLTAQQIELMVQDNGGGFDSKDTLDLKSLEATGHFGLAGMFERAELIGAKLVVLSEPMKGTRIQITCKPNGVG